MANNLSSIDNNVFLYLDLSLINGLSSVYLNGYIQRNTLKNIRDGTLVGKVGCNGRNRTEENKAKEGQRNHQNTAEGKIDINIDTKKKYKITNYDYSSDKYLEGRGNLRVEETVETIYTTFSLHRQLFSYMNSSNLVIPGITSSNISSYSLSAGNYVELTGEITCVSIICYVDYLITILNSFQDYNDKNKNSLNDLLKDKNPGIWNYTSISIVLTKFKQLLSESGTQDLVLMCGERPVILTVTSNGFLETTTNIFDHVNCCCKVFGKVAKCCEGTDCINLLRKTGNAEYYDSFLKAIEPYLQILRDNGIPIPPEPPTYYDQNPMLVIPISIYM